MNKVAALKTTTFNHNGKQVKGIGGRKGLKKPAILKIQGHFGAAIRNNVGNVPGKRCGQYGSTGIETIATVGLSVRPKNRMGETRTRTPFHLM